MTSPLKIFGGFLLAIWFTGAALFSIHDLYKTKERCIDKEGLLKGWLWCSEEGNPYTDHNNRIIKNLAWPLSLIKDANSFDIEEAKEALVDARIFDFIDLMNSGLPKDFGGGVTLTQYTYDPSSNVITKYGNQDGIEDFIVRVEKISKVTGNNLLEKAIKKNPVKYYKLAFEKKTLNKSLEGTCNLIKDEVLKMYKESMLYVSVRHLLKDAGGVWHSSDTINCFK